MIKYSGMAIALLGMLFIAAVLIRGRQQHISEKKRELDLILEAGYGAMHRAEFKKRTEISGDGRKTCGIKVPPKKRPLSKEAREILELVEEQKRSERSLAERTAAAVRKQDMKGNTTGVMEDRQNNKEIGQPTGIMNRYPGRADDSTGIMAARKPGKRKGDRTDIMPRRKGNM